MGAVAIHYRGNPNPKLSKPGKILCWGTNGSLKVNLEKGVWFNHEENVGGGVADFIRHYEKSNKKVHEILRDVFKLESDFEQIQPSTIRQLVAQYDYFNADGELKYSVERFEWYEGLKRRKTFRQKHYEGEREIYNMDGVTPLPYNLPAILKKPKATLFVVEGEKSVMALTAVGLTASCNHGGASKWHSELNEYFRGRNVVIIPDNDLAGKNHAANVANSLLECAASIKILALDGLPEKGDVVDWLENGGTRERLIELAKSASFINENQASANPDDGQKKKFRFRLLDLAGIYNMPAPEWLIDGIFPLKSFGAMYGEPGQGKTFVALDMGLCVAHGVEWHGRAVKQGAVLYIVGEGVGGLGNRIKAWINHHSGRLDAPFYAVPSSVNLRSPEDVNEVLNIIDSLNVNFTLIFIDTVARAILGGDENSSTDIGQFIASCDIIKEHTGAAVIGVHHSGKDTERGMRGSSALLGAVDTCLFVQQPKDKLIVVEMEKQKDAEAIKALSFDALEVEFGIDKRSIVLKLGDHKGVAKKKVITQTDFALQYLRDTIICSSLLLHQIPATHIDLWKAECQRRGLSGGNQDAQAKAFDRAFRELKSMGVITYDNGVVAIIKDEK